MNPVTDKERECLRRMGSVGRLRVAFGLWDFARDVVATAVRSRHPDWSAEQVREAVRTRMRSHAFQP
jgi:hypothetical protein